MLSRRNVRIKVMQALYMANRDQALSKSRVLSHYRADVQRSYDLFLFNIHNLFKIAKQSKADKQKRGEKYIPSSVDKHFNDHLYHNKLIQYIADHPELFQSKKSHFNALLDEEGAQKCYSLFAKSDFYRDYAQLKSPSREDHAEVFVEIFKVLIRSEYYLELLDDHYPNWIDDDSIVIGSVKRFIRALPLQEEKDMDEFKPQDVTVTDFGEKLLLAYLDHDESLSEKVKPFLNNWELDRIAILDAILIKLATEEFLNFESIPAKVTINEYIDISKEYSTDKSKDFLNGILDNIMKHLQESGEMQKKGRGLIN